jgi:small subunit ribosomal protein S6
MRWRKWASASWRYEIDDFNEGYYVLIKFTSNPSFPAELDRVLGITDGVIRSLVTLRYA